MKKLFGFGFLVLLLALGMAFIGCSSDDDDDGPSGPGGDPSKPLVGQKLIASGKNGDGKDVVVTFIENLYISRAISATGDLRTGDYYEIYVDGVLLVPGGKGTISVSGVTITFIPDDGSANFTCKIIPGRTGIGQFEGNAGLVGFVSEGYTTVTPSPGPGDGGGTTTPGVDGRAYTVGFVATGTDSGAITFNFIGLGTNSGPALKASDIRFTPANAFTPVGSPQSGTGNVTLNIEGVVTNQVVTAEITYNGIYSGKVPFYVYKGSWNGNLPSVDIYPATTVPGPTTALMLNWTNTLSTGLTASQITLLPGTGNANMGTLETITPNKVYKLNITAVSGGTVNLFISHPDVMGTITSINNIVVVSNSIGWSIGRVYSYNGGNFDNDRIEILFDYELAPVANIPTANYPHFKFSDLFTLIKGGTATPFSNGNEFDTCDVKQDQLNPRLYYIDLTSGGWGDKSYNDGTVVISSKPNLGVEVKTATATLATTGRVTFENAVVTPIAARTGKIILTFNRNGVTPGDWPQLDYQQTVGGAGPVTGKGFYVGSASDGSEQVALHLTKLTSTNNTTRIVSNLTSPGTASQSDFGLYTYTFEYATLSTAGAAATGQTATFNFEMFNKPGKAIGSTKTVTVTLP